jgi:hypothetical protein
MDMMVGMALQVQQQQPRDAMRRIPGMVQLDRLIPALPQMAARQAVVLYIIRQFQLPDRHDSLECEQANPQPAADSIGNAKQGHIEEQVFPDRVGGMQWSTSGPRKLCALCTPGRMWPL